MVNEIKSLQVLDPRLPIGSLEAYLHYVSQIPMLTAEEEQELAKRLQKDNDLGAAKRLVLSHLRYVARVAKGYLGYGLPLADLIQEGNIGLMKAVRRFNPDMGVRMVTFAMHWIKAEIHEYILRNWRIVKVATTKAQRKLFFNLRNLKKRLGWMTQEEVDGVAKDLGVKPETVREMECKRKLIDVLVAILEPMRARRQQYENDLQHVKKLLQEGTAKANATSQQTLLAAKEKMHQQYF